MIRRFCRCRNVIAFENMLALLITSRLCCDERITESVNTARLASLATQRNKFGCGVVKPIIPVWGGGVPPQRIKDPYPKGRRTAKD